MSFWFDEMHSFTVARDVTAYDSSLPLLSSLESNSRLLEVERTEEMVDERYPQERYDHPWS